MKRKNIIVMCSLAVLGIILPCSCTSDYSVETLEASVGETTDDTQLSAGHIYLTFGTNTSNATRADATIQTDDETAVTKVVAVIFTDTDSGATTSGESDTEDGDDVFYECVELEDVTENTPLNYDGATTYELEIDEEGNYQLCFLANPNDELLEKVEALAEDSGTIADYKALVVEQDPATKPMLMNSTQFFAIISSVDTDLGTVYLERIMSRIDIVNLADGVTIDKAVFHLRTCKSLLINDSTTVLNADYLDSDKTYGNLKLVGNSSALYADGLTEEDLGGEGEWNALKSTIYSYEQFGTFAETEAEEDSVPTLLLQYHVGTDTTTTYTKEVTFATTDATTGETEPCYLKRNTYYLIKVYYGSTGTINVSLQVADWEDGDEFYLSAEDIKSNIIEFSVDETEVSVASLGMDTVIYVASYDGYDETISYTASTDAEWITLSSGSSSSAAKTRASSLTLSGDETLKITTETNDSTESRSGIITLVQDDTENQITITVTQAMKTYTFTASSTSLTLGYASGDSVSTTVTSTNSNGETESFTAEVKSGDVMASVSSTEATVYTALPWEYDGQSAVVTLTQTSSNKTITLYITQTATKSFSHFATKDTSVGDFMMCDGTIVDSVDVGGMSKGNKKYARAIVFYVGSDRAGSSGYNTGKAMSLRECTSTYKWSTDNLDEDLINDTTLAMCYNDYDGYGNCQTIKESGKLGYSSSNYPAIYEALNFSVLEAPGNTSGWYLPAIGEWWDILYYLGKCTSVNDYTTTETARSTDFTNDKDEVTSVRDSLNTAMSSVGSDNYDEFFTYISDDEEYNEDAYWNYASSSEYSDAYVFYIYSCMNYFYMYQITVASSPKSGLFSVRPILAF